MLAANVSPEDLQTAAASINVTVYNLRSANNARSRWLFTLRPIQPNRKPYREYGRYYRRGFHNDRTIAAVCWHGHRDFFRALFALAPDCKVQTRHTRQFTAAGCTWYTRQNFEQTFRYSDTNIGSQMQPMLYSDACWCGDTVLDRVTERLTGVSAIE